MIEVEGIRPRGQCYPQRHPRSAGAERHRRARGAGHRAGAPVVGTVGVLRPQKALDVLMRAARTDARPGLQVLIAGEGAERALEALTGELRPRGPVCFSASAPTSRRPRGAGRRGC